MLKANTLIYGALAAFERSKREAGLDELRFHDLRFIAISRLYRKPIDKFQCRHE